jgi:hypothetical protein
MMYLILAFSKTAIKMLFEERNEIGKSTSYEV